MNSGQIIESNGGGAGERDADAERVLEQEDKTLGLLPYKELVDFFLSVFSTVLTSLNFVGCITSNF
jgi:hypothetical protein